MSKDIREKAKELYIKILFGKLNEKTAPQELIDFAESYHELKSRELLIEYEKSKYEAEDSIHFDKVSFDFDVERIDAFLKER